MSAEHITSGTVPQRGDTIRFLLIKEVNATAGSGGAPDFINYAGPPVTNPPNLAYIVVDVNYRQWQYGSSGWQ